jgi:hypothetical protein
LSRAESTDGGSKTKARGYDVLRDPLLNKGDAFSPGERRELGLDGLLPDAVAASLEPQVDLAYRHYSAQPTDLAKHVYMLGVHDTNVTLFYALIQRHLTEMLPVVYDPTWARPLKPSARYTPARAGCSCPSTSRTRSRPPSAPSVPAPTTSI